jgi:predicted lipid carrier protein YhbT
MCDKNDIKAKIKDKLLDALKTPARVLPLWVTSIGAGALITAIVEGNYSFKKRLSELDGKLFLFKAADIDKNFYMLIKDSEIKIIPHSKQSPDVTMEGELKVLTELLLGTVDPDTVFFSRRLEISGDTAVAIHFKNILADI